MLMTDQSELVSVKYIICCGMYRSASTWQYLVASELIESTEIGHRIGYVTGANLPHIQNNTSDDDRILVLKCHDFHPIFGELIETGQAKAIYSYRDVRDVAYSLMQKLMIPFEQIIAPDSLFRQAVDSFYQWTNLPGILIQPYDDIENKSSFAVSRIAEYLGIQIDEQKALEIAKKFNLDANQARSQELAKDFARQGKNLALPENALLFDPQSLPHWNHISQRHSTGWRYAFDPIKLSRLEPIVGQWLIDVGLEKDTSWVYSTTNKVSAYFDTNRQWLHPVQVGTTSLVKVSTQASTIEAIVAILQRLVPDEYIEFMVQYYQQGLKKFGEYWGYIDQLTVLYAATKLLEPENYLEIGVFRGRSMSVVASLAPDCNLYGFDLWIENYSDLENPGADFVGSQLKRVGYRGQPVLISGKTQETIPEFLNTHSDLFFDLITVDGDHTEAGARADLENVLPRVKLGGVLVFDDITHPQHLWLERIWDEVVGANPNFISAKYTEVGHGVGFAVRTSMDPEVDAVSGDHQERLQVSGKQLKELQLKLEATLNQVADRDRELRSVVSTLKARDLELASIKPVLQARDEELASAKAVLQARDEEVASIKPVLQAREEELASVKSVLQAREEELASIKPVLHAREEELASVKTVLQAREEELVSIKAVLRALETQTSTAQNSSLHPDTR